MSDLKRVVHIGKAKDRLPDAAALYVHAFENDPVIAYMLSNLPRKEDRLAYFPSYFHTLMKAASLNGGIFEDIEDPYAPGGSAATEKVPERLTHIQYQCASVLIPPGKRVDNPWTLVSSGFFPVLWNIGINGCRRMLLEFEPKTVKAKAKVLGKNERYYYVFFIATREDCRGKRLAQDLIRHHQDIARKTGHAVWLEATTARSRDVYAKVGFKLVEEMVLGRGKVGSDGLVPIDKTVETPGVSIWGMIWRPESAVDGDIE